MQLRTRITLVVALVVLAYALGDLALQRFIVYPRFVELEARDAQTDVLRVERALDAEVATLDSRCAEWASWDEANAFVAQTKTGSSFAEHSLSAGSLRASRIDLLYLVDREGRVRFGEIRNPTSGERVRLPELDLEQLSPGHPYLPIDRASGTRGIAQTTLGPLFLASRELEGPQGGAVILGRLLSNELVKELRERTEVDFTWSDLSAPSELEPTLLAEVTASAEPVLRVRDESTLEGYASVDDLRGRPTLLVRATLPRAISAGGREALRYALISTIAAGLLLLFVLLALLRKTVVAPLGVLTRHAVEIGKSDDYGRAIALERGDEIGVLSREFESMMRKLERSRAELVDTARAAGMSEIATGILHNVGNALNSVGVSTEVIDAKLRSSRQQKLDKLAELVRAQGERFGEFVAHDPRGRHVAPFLLEVADGLRDEHAQLAEEVRTLASGVEHIRALVAAQQDFARKSELRESVELESLVDMAWGIVGRATSATLPELVREIEPLGRVPVQRHKLVQVLVNLLKNACESVAAAGRAPGRVTVVLRSHSGRLELEVRDDGLGISREHLPQLFRHGFTTKSDGHGFGLHSCANAATEMGGSIRVHSDGPGRGASFTLELPFAAREAA